MEPLLAQAGNYQAAAPQVAMCSPLQQHARDLHGSGPQWKGLIKGGEERKHSDLLRAMARAHEQAKEPVKATFNSHLPSQPFHQLQLLTLLPYNFFQFSVTIVSCSLAVDWEEALKVPMHLYNRESKISEVYYV
jgi:hypothetical protein